MSAGAKGVKSAAGAASTMPHQWTVEGQKWIPAFRRNDG
jgi:hypothetical protein